MRVANRVQSITYPDGEVVSYKYDRGGMLNRMEGLKGTQSFTYIDKIYYNCYGLKDAQWNGNGTHMKYSYDTLLRLSLMESWDVLGRMQEVSYSYDRAGNITGIQNTAPISPNGLGGTYAMTYAYDSLYRLQGSAGGLTGEKNYSYWLDMAYAANGRILRKSQLARTYTGTSSDTLMNYANFYDYGTTPVSNQVRRVNDTIGAGSPLTFSWDDNGNLLRQSTGTQTRIHCWDELNRLQGSTDTRHTACFLYDGSGERFYKFSGAPQAMMVNGQWSTYHALTDPTLYASPYLVATPKGYTKHYYAESERVASKVGGGGLQNLHTVAAGVLENEWMAKRDSCAKHVTRVAGCLGVEIGDMKTNALVVLNQYAAGAQTSPHSEDECYWYHPDHLGSASWVSDKAGKGIQHLYYLPWGEELDNQRATDYASRYTFSGKERDEETGYSYFGARYYNSDLSIWLSVDPMADKYPGLSPYTYCANNPVKLVDPDGRDIYVDGDASEKFAEALSTKNVTYSIDANGCLTPSGKPKTYRERLLNRIIKDHSIRVNITAQNSRDFSINGKECTTRGGSFLGNSFFIGPHEFGKEPLLINTFQLISFDGLNAEFNTDKDIRKTIVHEISESYYGGKISIKLRQEAQPGYSNIKNKIYNRAHRRAPRHPIPNSEKRLANERASKEQEYDPTPSYLKLPQKISLPHQ